MNIRATADEKTKVTIKTGSEPSDKGKGWPKNGDEWRYVISRAAPWVVAGLVAVAVGTAYKRSTCEDSKSGMSYGELTRRKANRARDSAGNVIDDARENVERGWFGLRKKADKAEDAAEDAAKKAKGAVKDKARDAKESAYGAKDYVADKAHEAKEAAKGAYGATVDAGKHAADKAESTVRAVGSKGLAAAGSAEEKTGNLMREAGDRLEKDGKSTKSFYGGEAAKAEAKKKWFGLF